MTMVKLSKKVIETVENNDFSMEDITEQDGRYYVEMNQSTPEGEDWWETIWFDGTDKGFIKSVKNRAENFNIDEEAEIWIESRGKNGVPESIKDLVEDQEWKQEQLETLANELKENQKEFIHYEDELEDLRECENLYNDGLWC